MPNDSIEMFYEVYMKDYKDGDPSLYYLNYTLQITFRRSLSIDTRFNGLVTFNKWWK